MLNIKHKKTFLNIGNEYTPGFYLYKTKGLNKNNCFIALFKMFVLSFIKTILTAKHSFV